MVRMSESQAELTAQEAIAFLISSQDILQRFLATTGIDPLEIRANLGKRSFLKGVMQYLIEDEGLLISFAASTGRRPEEVAAAAVALGVRWES